METTQESEGQTPSKPKGKVGGARPGAGRPKGSKSASTITKEQARESLREVVFAHMEGLLAAQIDNAMGIKYLVVRDKKSGKFVRVGESAASNSDEETIEVYEKEPSVQAFTDLMNRALDKAKEQEQEVKHSGGFVITHEIAEE